MSYRNDQVGCFHVDGKEYPDYNLDYEPNEPDLNYCFDSDDSCMYPSINILYLENRALKNKIIKKIAHLSTFEDIEQVTKFMLVEDVLSNYIEMYSKKSFLSNRSIELAKQNNCLAILIKGTLRRHANYILNDHFVAEISSFVRGLYVNKKNEDVFSLVNDIQHYLHKKVQEKLGQNAHLELNSIFMRNVLSTARLHLNIYHFKFNFKSNLSTKSVEALYEFKDPRKKTVEKWHDRMAHKSSFNDYLLLPQHSYLHNKISVLTLLKNENLSVSDFKKCIVCLFFLNGEEIEVDFNYIKAFACSM